MMRSLLPNLARLVPVYCLSLVACSGTAEDLQNAAASGASPTVEASAAPLDWRAALLTATDTAQPTAAGVSASLLPPHCLPPVAASGLSFFVAGGNLGYGAAGLAFAPGALLVSGGPASSSSTSFFFAMRLDPRAAAWQPLAFMSPQLQYLAPLENPCGF